MRVPSTALLGSIAHDTDVKQEVKDRLTLWETGRWEELLGRVTGAAQQLKENSGRDTSDPEDPEAKGGTA